MRRIVDAHRKNRNPDDQVFLEFARRANKQGTALDVHEKYARPVLAQIPYPYGVPWWEQPKAKSKAKPAGTKRKKRIIRCGICGVEGHNARTCPNKPDTSTVTHTDGIERLSPGFDPNPPKVEEEQEDT